MRTIYSLMFMLILMATFQYGYTETAELGQQNLPPTILIIKKIPLTVDGKTSEIYRIEQPNGTWGYQGVKGQYFNVIVKNDVNDPTILHWHGLILPNDQDGVPYVTQLPIPPGGQFHYYFKLVQAGTYWMHSHYGLQTQQLLSAPLIINDPADVNRADQQVIMFLTDFSFKSPRTLLDNLRNNSATMMNDFNNAAVNNINNVAENNSVAGNAVMSNASNSTDNQMNNMSMTNSVNGKQAVNMTNATSMSNNNKPDLNDIDYDAYLTNYHTLSNPDIIKVQAGTTVRLRIINGSAASNFFIDTGTLSGTLIAADGETIKPFTAKRYQIAMGQRLDILVKIPAGQGAYPIIAQVEGTTKQTGLLLVTPQATIPSFTDNASVAAGALDYSQEMQLHAVQPLPQKPVDRVLTVDLDGDMSQYIWKINNQIWPNVTPLQVSSGQRVMMIFNNKTGMGHPMHFHGHVFEITAINGKPIVDGVIRDTIFVLPHTTVAVQFDANNPGVWMLHCHMLYHQQTGMSTTVNYTNFKVPQFPKMASGDV